MFEQLLQKLNAGQPLSAEDNKALIDVLKSFASGKVPADTPLNYQQAVDMFGPALQKALNTPEGKLAVNDAIKDRQTERFVKRNKPFFDAILGGVDLATSLSQIKESNKAIRELVKPTLPNPNVLDPALNAAIADAQKGNLESLRALEPAKQEIALQRMNDQQVAKSVSGGQSSTFGALSNASSLRAMRAGAELPRVQDAIRARQQQRADSLIGVRQGQLQNNFNNSLGVADRNLQQYTADLAAAGALGQAGRTNLRNTLTNLPNTLTRSVGAFMPTPPSPYVQQTANRVDQQLTGPASLYQQYKQSLENSIAGRINQTKANVANRFRSPRMQQLAGWTSNYSLPDSSYPQRLPFNDSSVQNQMSQMSREDARAILMNPNTAADKKLRYQATQAFYGRN